MRMLSKMLVVLTGGLFALLPAANAATCKGGKRADSAGRCKASPAKKAPTKAKVKAKSGKKAKAVAAAPEKGPLYVFVESGGCRILAAESSVRRMQEIAVGGAVTWGGKCSEGLISGTGVLRQEGVFIEGGRSKHFAYYYSGRAKNGVRTGPWTRETLERFDDSVRSWTSLARVEFVNGVAKGAPKPVPVRGADQHSKSFTTRVLDPEAKRAQAVAQATPPAADADALNLRAAPAVATTAPAVASPPSIPAPAAPQPPQPKTPLPPNAAAPTPSTVPAAPKGTLVAPTATADGPPRVTASIPTAPPTVAPAPTPAPPAAIRTPPPVPTPQKSVPPTPPAPPKPAVHATIAAPPPQAPEPVKVAAVKPAPPPVVPTPTSAPAAVPKAPPPAPVVAPSAAIQTTPAKPAVVVAPPPPAAVKLAPALPEAMQKQAFGFSTSCYMDTLDGQIWENAVLTVKDRSSLLIDGWAVDDEERVLAEATYLRLEGADGRRYHAATTVQERPDVARHFNTPAYVKAGYRTVVSVEGLPPGEYEATIVMSSKGRNLLCGNGRRMKL